MEELTGIRAFDWVLAELYAVAAALVLGALFWRVPGTRVCRVLLVPLVVGVAGLAVLAIAFMADTRTLLGNVVDRAAALFFAGFAMVVGAAIADFLVSRIAPLVAYTRAFRRTAFEADAALAVALLVPAVLGLAAIVGLDQRTISSRELSEATASGGVVVEADHELPDQPMDVSMRSATEGYFSFRDGDIARFVLDEESEALVLTVEASGLDSPRGLAVVGDALIVADLGPLPCEPQFPCKGENVDAASREEGERRILRESNGRLVRFDIREDGTLANRRIILDGIPVANSEHGVNAVTAGADGRVYVSVGNLDRLGPKSLTDLDRARPHFDWLGAVLSLRPDGTGLRVVARGTRNVYDLAFDDEQRLYGADNDGETRAGWRREEVLEIREGADYGYPSDGTFAPYSQRTAPAVWLLDTAGSAGVEWLRWDGRPTLVVGSCDDVYAVELDEAAGAVTVTNRAAVRHLLTVTGCVTAVESLADGRLAMTVYTFGDTGRAYVIRLEP